MRRSVKLPNRPAPLASMKSRSASVGSPEPYYKTEEELLGHTPRSAVSEIGLNQIREIEGPNGILTQYFIEFSVPGTEAYTRRVIEALIHKDRLREMRELAMQNSDVPRPTCTMRID